MMVGRFIGIDRRKMYDSKCLLGLGSLSLINARDSAFATVTSLCIQHEGSVPEGEF